jgi:hypothetical protein
VQEKVEERNEARSAEYLTLCDELICSAAHRSAQATKNPGDILRSCRRARCHGQEATGAVPSLPASPVVMPTSTDVGSKEIAKALVAKGISSLQRHTLANVEKWPELDA